MKTYEIAVVPGDGIGPEVCDAAVRVVEAACGRDVRLDLRSYRAGANCYLETGEGLPLGLGRPRSRHLATLYRRESSKALER